MKNAVQRFGKFLSSMVMPNIGAFIAWGFITALFIEKGWLPNAQLATLNGPMLNYLLPVLIAFQGGKLIGGDRGGVMGAIATIGVIVGAPDYPMLMGAMVMGPLAGFVIKKFDQAMDGRMPAGFEMLINNFSIGIFGMLLAIVGYYAIGPFMSAVLVVLKGGVQVLVDHSLLPLAAIFIEPAKVLFLNNAINHGIFTPIGIEQAAEAGKSIMYMLEANPGPGLGLLLAYWAFSKDKATKDSAPGAIIIHFFGGIHEIYFPYILMNPLVIVGPIAGNICAILFYSITKAGLVGPSAPGSIIAFMSMSPKTSIAITALGVLIAATVSFLVSSPIVKMAGSKSLEDAQKKTSDMKAESKGQAAEVLSGADGKADDIKKIVFACDAGMGSSAMGVTILKKKLEEIGLKPEIKHVAVADIPKDADVVVTNVNLEERAKMSLEGTNIPILTLSNFMDQTEYERIIVEIQRVLGHDVPDVFCKDNIVLNAKYANKEEAIKACADIFIKGGYTDESYKADMLQRDKEASVYLGNGVALPHGLASSKETIKNSGICFVQVPDGVDFNGEKAYLLVGVAGKGEEHVELLGKIGQTLMDEGVIEKLKNSTSKEEVINLLNL